MKAKYQCEQKLLPYNQWSDKDKKLLADLKKFRITPSEAYQISWALFTAAQRDKRIIEEMQCPKCYMKSHNMRGIEEFKTEKKRVMQHIKASERINKFFSPYHNVLGADYNDG